LNGISLKFVPNQKKTLRGLHNFEMRMQDGCSKMVPFKQDTEIYGQVGREKMRKDTIINDR